MSSIISNNILFEYKYFSKDNKLEIYQDKQLLSVLHGDEAHEEWKRITDDDYENS